MYLVINKWVIAVNVPNFSGQYLRNHWILDIGFLGYIGIVWPKEHSPEVWSVPAVTLCIQDARCLKVKLRESAFKQFKSPVLIVLKVHNEVAQAHQQLMRQGKFVAVLMPKVDVTQRKHWFSALRTITTYPQTRNALENAVSWAIFRRGKGGNYNSWSPLSPNLNP